MLFIPGMSFGETMLRLISFHQSLMNRRKLNELTVMFFKRQ